MLRSFDVSRHTTGECSAFTWLSSMMPELTCCTSNLNLFHTYIDCSFCCPYHMLNHSWIGWQQCMGNPPRICKWHHFIAPTNWELSSGPLSKSLPIHWLETSFWCCVCSWRRRQKSSISYRRPQKASTYHDTNSPHHSKSQHCTMRWAESAHPVGEWLDGVCDKARRL